MVSTRDDGIVVSTVTVIRYVRNTGGSRYPRHLSAVSSRGTGVPGPTIVRGVVPPQGVPTSIKGEENETEDHPGRARGPPKQNNSPTPLLGTAMISYFCRGARIFFPS